MTSVIFACVHNAGRSQIAASFFNAIADPARARALSAGTEPAERVHPEVVDAMREVGIDLSNARPQRLGWGLGTTLGYHLPSPSLTHAFSPVTAIALMLWLYRRSSVFLRVTEEDEPGQSASRVRTLRLLAVGIIVGSARLARGLRVTHN